MNINPYLNYPAGAAVFLFRGVDFFLCFCYNSIRTGGDFEMIFTSYYGNLKRIFESKLVFDEKSVFEISYGNSRDWFLKKEWLLVPDANVLFDYKSGKISWRDYCLNFYEKLNKFDEKFWKNFVDENCGNLYLCFEKNAMMCHRYLVGKFLFWRLGKSCVVEIDSNLKFWKIEKTLVKV